MINRNFFLILLYLLLIGCGFTPIYNQNNNLEFWIEIDKIEGDKTLNNFIELNLNRYSLPKTNRNKIVISINSEYTKNTTVKNMSGVATEHELIANIEFDIYYNNKSKNLKFSEKLNIKKSDDTFDDSNYERSSLNNFASSIIQKLIIELIKLNDY